MLHVFLLKDDRSIDNLLAYIKDTVSGFWAKLFISPHPQTEKIYKSAEPLWNQQWKYYNTDDN